MPRINSPIPVREIAAGSDTYDRGYHKGNAGGLDAVDTDLAAANIKNAVAIFGVTGSFSETLAEDILGTAKSGDFSNTSRTYTYRTESIPLSGNYDVATLAQAYDASSMAVGCACVHAQPQTDDVLKLQIIMAGVTVAESAFLTAAVKDVSMYSVIGTKALSGAQTCIARLHNYDAGVARSVHLTCGVVNDEDMAAIISVGSIKKT